MCGRRCVYRAFDGACCYHAIEGKSRIAQIYKELGVTKVTDEVRERLRPKNCRFYEHGRSRAEKKQMLLPGSSGRSPCKMDAHEAEARRLYDEGLQDAQIAEKLGLSKVTVFEWRKKKGLPAHPKESRMRQHEDEARRLYDEGKTDREIGDAVGVTTSTVFRWRKDNGLPTKYQP